MLLYRSDFVTYPVVVQYYFNRQQQLSHIIIQPGYVHDDPTQFTSEYQQISQYLIGLWAPCENTRADDIMDAGKRPDAGDLNVVPSWVDDTV